MGGGVMMLSEVCIGCGRSDAEAIVLYSVDPTVIFGVDGVMGWTGSDRDWYHASTL